MRLNLPACARACVRAQNGFIRLPFGDSNACCVGCEAVIIEATTATKATNLVEEK